MRRTNSFSVLAILSLLSALTFIGCSEQPAGDQTEQTLPSDAAVRAGMVKARRSEVPAAGEVVGADHCFFAVDSTTEGLNRKIIYNAQVELVVEDFTGVPDQVVTLNKSTKKG